LKRGKIITKKINAKKEELKEFLENNTSYYSTIETLFNEEVDKAKELADRKEKEKEDKKSRTKEDIKEENEKKKALTTSFKKYKDDSNLKEAKENYNAGFEKFVEAFKDAMPELDNASEDSYFA